MRGRGWATRELTANCQPALATYAPAVDGVFLPHSLQVLTVHGGRITHNVVFADPRLFDRFGLPSQIPSEKLPQER